MEGPFNSETALSSRFRSSVVRRIESWVDGDIIFPNQVNASYYLDLVNNT